MASTPLPLLRISGQAPFGRRLSAIAVVSVLAVAAVGARLELADAATGVGHSPRARASSTGRKFPASTTVDVSLSFRWRAPRRCTLMRFSVNHVGVVMTSRRLWVRGLHATVSVKRPKTRVRHTRLSVRLDVPRRAIRVAVDGRHVRSTRAKLVAESRVVVASTTGACAAARVASVAVRPSARIPGSRSGVPQPQGATRPQALPAPDAGSGAPPAKDAGSGALPATDAGSADGSTKRLFADDSVWNAPLADDAPLDPESPLLAGALRDEAKRELAAYSGPYVATNAGVPVYTVPRDQPTVPVVLDSWDFGTSLAETFAAGVPIPADAVPANNPDQSLVIWQPSTDRMWEFFVLRKAADGWHARWGGAMDRVSRSSGYFSAASFAGASNRWGSTATSLALAGGLMLRDEVQSFRIDHALALSVGSARKGVWSWPAQRSDGENTQPDAIPEGARFRLDPSLDLSKLDMPPITRAMAEAAQRYGIIVRDQTGQGLCFWAEDPTRFGTNYRTDLFDGMYPTQYLRSFPWDRLQLLRMDLRTPAG
jgi:hypothetical protein